MQEEIIIKREWVKKAGILFLVLMLLLTLFSKTIMNNSLPQVYVQEVQAGSIQHFINGTGEAQPISLYEVAIDENRKIKEVFVEIGDTVAEGDVIFTLEQPQNDDELEQSYKMLQDLKFQKQKMLLSMDNADYVSENRKIDELKEELNYLKEFCKEIGFSSSELRDCLKTDYDMKTDIYDKQNELRYLQRELSQTDADDDDYNELSEKIDKMQNRITRSEEHKQSLTEYINLNNQLSNLQFQLEQQKEKDNVSSSIADVDYQKLLSDIQDQEQQIADIKNGTAGDKVVAQRSGTIENLTVGAGLFATPNTSMATIATAEQGYRLSLIVSKEESQRIKIGDIAETNDNSIQAILTGIKTVPDTKGEEKELLFLLQGEVENSEQYSVSFTAKANQYEQIIPKNALYSDSNGSFVLIVKAERTAFGQRFTAKRVSVEVLETGEQNVAIKSSGLSYNDYVITTSTKPVSDKMKVRMSYE